MSKAFVNPREYAEASAAERELVKGRGGFRPRKKAMTRAEHKEAYQIEYKGDQDLVFQSPPIPLSEAQAFQSVIEELARTSERVLPADPLRRVALVVEEAGEAMKTALDYTRTDDHLRAEYLRRQDVRDELTQTAAMAIRVLGAMDEEDRAPKRTKNRPLIGPYRRRTTK